MSMYEYQEEIWREVGFFDKIQESSKGKETERGQTIRYIKRKREREREDKETNSKYWFNSLSTKNTAFIKF